MSRVLKILGAVVAVVVLIAAGGLVWAGSASADMLARTIDVHEVDYPLPAPLDSADMAEAGVGPGEMDAAAAERAIARGRHLVDSRFACTVCHGQDFGGGVMIDAPVMGVILGPNITTGEGSRTLDYQFADWDRIVRHGVLPDGRPAAMPSEDFRRMSDRELSDVVMYIRSLPPVNAEVPGPKLGPLGKVLVATGQLPLSADVIGDHFAAHRPEPPEEAVSVEFGQHLAGVCMGCHTASLAGGKVPGGDPSWPPAANLTPHADGLAGWTFEDFRTALTEGTRPDGTTLRMPMVDVLPYARNMTDVELEAMWTYLQSVPPAPTPR